MHRSYFTAANRKRVVYGEDYGTGGSTQKLVTVQEIYSFLYTYNTRIHRHNRKGPPLVFAESRKN
jgi:hypothetical protein